MMVIAGSLQLSNELGLCKSHGCGNRIKTVVGGGRLHLLSISLSSYSSDSWSLSLSNSAYRPKRSLHSRYNVITCRSVLMPGQGNGIPILKTAAVALTRSYSALNGSPLVIQLVPAVGIIVFTIWGLPPLLRMTRNLLLHRSDSSWKKSSTHYVMTSYLQPMLLWAGATLICRAFDPVVLPSEASQAVKHRFLNFVKSLSTVMAFAYCLSSLIQQTQKFFMEATDSSDTRNMGFNFAGKAIYTAVWVAAVSLFMELLGFSTQKWLTAGGLGTVLLTLAGREIFTNFLSSVMIHATRPFVLNEWIQTKIEGYEVSGTVEHVGWWSPTIIRGDDREAVHIPNHKFTVSVVRNLSQKSHWRIKTHLAISHLDVNKINNIVADMRKVLAKNPQVEQQRLHRRVFLDNIDPENQALLIMVSCFVKTSHFEEYLCVKEAILLDLLRVVRHHRARLATPIRTVQKVYSDADVENIPFADTIFTRTRPAANRPFLLIEPPYKINGDDKIKPQGRSVHANEEQDAKGTERQTSDTNAEARVEAASTFDSKADAKIGAMPTSDSKAEPTVAATSISDSKLEEKVAAMSEPSKSKALSSVRDSSVQTNPDKQSEVDSIQMGTGVSTPPSKTQLGGLDSMGLSSKDITLLGAAFEKPPVSLSETSDERVGVPHSSQPKQENETLPVPPPSIARTVVEDNIVLGVALEGSKRTLPIEEGMHLPPASAESKLAACRNGSGSSSAGKDKKEGQIPNVPGAAAGDQRDHGR
ncbi:PREDICTED: mechanosensitive ion channel protein 2, chloroplastic-like [Nelumbo nucifera]|uniref:Mechanosensitive ion channel protein 2, chloroplastic-like n=2 Tax=Nelumbo nucifera TaxID=4432 RepID=A0A822XSH3_NELNU|nr:PREDICTED: mechanosensitive ion channel protein 2, chloroplastic-like [Nelumbo nucifera]DAD22111.1 TPA_asm: hypothetical protein HUJ06_023574 [Nelumbo nucifera]